MLLIILGIFIGIPIGIVFEKYVFPYLDIKFEIFTYEQSVVGTENQLTAQAMVKKFEKEYGEAQELTPAIGFHTDDIREVDEDECEDINKSYDVLNCDGEKAIGFKMKY